MFAWYPPQFSSNLSAFIQNLPCLSNIWRVLYITIIQNKNFSNELFLFGCNVSEFFKHHSHPKSESSFTFPIVDVGGGYDRIQSNVCYAKSGLWQRFKKEKKMSSFICPFLKEEIKGLNKNLLESIPLQNHIPDRCVTSCYSSPFCFTPFIPLTGAELHGMRWLFPDVNICILKTLPSFEECNGYPHRDIRETFEVSALLPAFVFWACNMNE